MGIDRDAFAEKMAKIDQASLHRGGESVELAAMHFAQFMRALGHDPYGDNHHLRDTPVRVAEMYAALLGGGDEPTEAKFELDGIDSSQMVMVRDIPFTSFCAHHWLPFSGRATVAYIPSGGFVVGLSKLARIVEATSRRPQVQERMTKAVVSEIVRITGSVDVAVLIHAEHTCMTIRGVKAHGSSTVTSAVLGAFRENPGTRAEFLSMIEVGK